MSATTSLITIAIIAWILQIVFGWLQVNRFNRAFAELAKKGKVGIGRNAGRFKAKVIIALAFDENLVVVDAIMMKGFTVFSSPQPLPELIGIAHSNIQPARIFPQNKNAQDALIEAILLKQD